MEYAGLNNPIYSFRLTAVTCSPLFTSTGMSFPLKDKEGCEDQERVSLLFFTALFP